jgi:hypothetical protein
MRKRHKLTHDEVMARLKAKQGERSLRVFGAELGLSAAYLSDVYLGRRGIGPKLLKTLGLTKEEQTTVTYSAAKESVTA